MSCRLRSPACELDRHVDRRPDLLQALQIDRQFPGRQLGVGGQTLDLGMKIGRPAECAVQIDDVQPLRAQLDPVAGHLRRVIAVDGLFVRIALPQAYTTSVPQINCRIDSHNADVVRRSPAGIAA